VQSSIFFALKETVETLAAKVKFIEEQIIETFNKITQQLIYHCSLRDSISQEIENIVRGEYLDAGQLKDQCRKLIDFVQLNKSKALEINPNQFPERVLKSLMEYEVEFVKQIKQISQIQTKQFINIENILKKQY